MVQASIFNDGHKMEQLRGAGTWCNETIVEELKATIHGVVFKSITKNAQFYLAREDIDDEVFWKGILCLLRTFFQH